MPLRSPLGRNRIPNEYFSKKKKKIKTGAAIFFYSHCFFCNFAVPAHIFLITRRIIRVYIHRINTANDVNERTRLAARGFIYLHFLLFFSSRLIGFTFDALWSRVFKHSSKWKRFRAKSNRRIVAFNEHFAERKKKAVANRSGGRFFRIKSAHRYCGAFILNSTIYARKGTSSTPSIYFPYFDNLLRKRFTA